MRLLIFSIILTLSSASAFAQQRQGTVNIPISLEEFKSAGFTQFDLTISECPVTAERLKELADFYTAFKVENLSCDNNCSATIRKQASDAPFIFSRWVSVAGLNMVKFSDQEVPVEQLPLKLR